MSRHLGSDKDVEKLRRIAERGGFQVFVTGNNHLKWRTPDGTKTFVTALSFGDKRRIKKLEKFLRENGLDV